MNDEGKYVRERATEFGFTVDSMLLRVHTEDVYETVQNTEGETTEESQSHA